jgi:hypothetical protein
MTRATWTSHLGWLHSLEAEARKNLLVLCTGGALSRLEKVLKKPDCNDKHRHDQATSRWHILVRDIGTGTLSYPLKTLSMAIPAACEGVVGSTSMDHTFEQAQPTIHPSTK